MYLTVKEAIETSGKSQTTIHRLCQKHEKSKYIKKENNKYLIDKDFLIENYPFIKASNSEEVLDSETEKKLLNVLTEKNLQITELTLKVKKLNEVIEEKDQAIKKFEDEMFDHQHELAETIDANIHYERELSAVKSVNNFSASPVNELLPDFNTEKKMLIYKVGTITVSVLVLIAFIFLMYYFTK